MRVSEVLKITEHARGQHLCLFGLQSATRGMVGCSVEVCNEARVWHVNRNGRNNVCNKNSFLQLRKALAYE